MAEDQSGLGRNRRRIYRVNMSNLFARSISFKSRLIELALFTVLFSFLTLFVAGYVSKERYIYFWDFIVYHKFYIDLGTMCTLNTFHALHYVISSVREGDYNLLPTVFLMPFRLAFGAGRLAYVLSITVTFVFPTIILFSTVVRRLRGNSATQSLFDDVCVSLIPALALALLPQLWVPVLLGYVDVGGLIIIFVVLLLYFRVDFLEQSFGNL